MRLSKGLLGPTNEIRPNHFREQGNGMSVDWAKYSTPQETRNRSRRSEPKDYAVISFVVGAIRSIKALEVVHSPVQENTVDEVGQVVPPNRAHSDVTGISSPPEEKVEKRLKLSRIFKPEIAIGD
jgi:hypothetical protein